MIDFLEPRRHFAATLTPAQTYSTSIATVGAQKNWTIPLVAGQNVTLAAGDRSGGALQTELILIGPTGKVYRRSVGEEGSFISLNVPVGGDWRVRLRDVGRDNTGSVKLTAFYYASTIADSDDVQPPQSGRRQTADIDPGDLDVWTVTAQAGQYLYVIASENTPGEAVDPAILLIDPTGKVAGGSEGEKANAVELTNALAGNYYAVIYDHGADEPGRYGFSIGRAPGEQYPNDVDAAQFLPPGQTRNGNLPGGDQDIYQLNLTAGQTLTATITETTGSLEPSFVLIEPTGQPVARTNGSPSATLTYTALTTGTFYLIARDFEGDDGGQYAISYALT